MLITQTESNPYYGRQLIGRIQSGQISVGDKLTSINQDGTLHENGKIMRIVKKLGMNEFELEKAFAGDIVSIAGFHNSTVGNTINEAGNEYVIPAIPIDPPTLSLTVAPNDSPL